LNGINQWHSCLSFFICGIVLPSICVVAQSTGMSKAGILYRDMPGLPSIAAQTGKYFKVVAFTPSNCHFQAVYF
jgi:hypothetical protein